MSQSDQPDKKPPPQRTVAWNPEDIPGLDEDPAAAAEAGEPSGESRPAEANRPPTGSQPTMAWDPADLDRPGEPPRGSQPTVAMNPADLPRAAGPSSSQPTMAFDPADLPPAPAPQGPDETGEGAEDAVDPLVGTMLRGKWEVLKKLGAGSFGTVYKVRDIKGGWIEALKILGVDRLTGAEAENMRKRFLREAQIMKRLGSESPHIVGLSTYEEDIEAGLVYFLMEFVEGRSLADALAQEGPFPAERTIALGLQVCDALIAAHEGPESIVHRDLKLENLMLTKDRGGHETVKVLDFGIAKIAEREADSRLTTVGTLGTPGYAAPEQLRAENVDGRTDLFAFGVILYSLLTGRDPWLGNVAYQPTHQIYELMVATDRGEVRPLAQSGVEIPPALANIVMKLLRRNPDERFQSARELQEALHRVEAGGVASDAGSLRVLTDKPGIKVEIRAGRKVVAEGPTPCVANGVEAGTYRIAVRDPRYEPLETSVTLAPGAMEDVTVVPKARKTGVGAAAKRRPGMLVAAVIVALALAGTAVVRPWGRTLDADALRTRAAAGSVGAAWLVEGGIDGLLSVGPIRTPFHTQVTEEGVPTLLADLRQAGLTVDTSLEIRRLTDLASQAQAAHRYFGSDGSDVRTYASRLAQIEPGSPEARALFLKVGERMAWDADEAIEEGSPDAARTLVRDCLALVPDHPRCTAVASGL